MPIPCAFLFLAMQSQAPRPSPTPTPPPAAPGRADGSASPAYSSAIEVTDTRVPEEADRMPDSITVVTGRELRDHGATDLKSALAFVSGVDIAPGGDAGPASAVPEFWGLKEFDAFLLVVDGVPWGGAFNPALSTLDLHDVDRIEVLHGPAPVMYGATSFVGVIQVVHKAGGEAARELRASGGSWSSYGGSLSAPLPAWAGLHSSIDVDAQRQGQRDDRTAFRRGHLLWRNTGPLGKGTIRFDIDGDWTDQDPASPHPREGGTLSGDVPLDANHNLADAHLDHKQGFLSVAYQHPAGAATWEISGSVTRSHEDVLRGFLVDLSDADPDAHGFRETIHRTDIYADTHLAWTGARTLHGVAGFDFLHGAGDARGGDFDYHVGLDGSGAPTGATKPSESDIRLDLRRDFLGAYGQVEWEPSPEVRVQAGLRLNHTREKQDSSGVELSTGEGSESEGRRNTTRLSGGAGVVWTPWTHDAENLRFFANYRDTFKPAAASFNLGEADAGGGGDSGLLKPETARSYEMGVRARLLEGRLGLEASGFWMDFRNLVVPQSINGLPAVVNAGRERLKGVETSLTARIAGDLDLRLAYAYHDARFRDFLTEFDGVPTQLSGKRLEMSPHHLGSAGLGWFPARGLLAQARVSWVGSRFLNKRNTALAGSYATLGASAGWRGGRWELRVDASNLTDRRDPVSESEIGDSQYYRLPARRVEGSATLRF